ncbi:MAG: DEAD/DEAH box helicase [Terriglobia bacterium]
MNPPDALSWATPVVRDWFARRFGTPTEPQEQGWPEIAAGKDTLISAPTGSGKTLAAFLACIDRLARKALAGELADRIEVVYVSPLKALGNDIHRNLEIPLREITELAGERGLLMPPIRAAVRSGDTPAPERRAMLARPPHILVTTPESLYILLTAEKSRAILRDVETVIVDEIHAVADDKRGAHLALSLERLDALAAAAHPERRAPVRIGLSATQEPIELMGGFLVGAGRQEPAIVNIGHRRAMDLAVEIPASELGPIATNEMWDEIYDRLAALAREHRSTLIFVNTRRLVERLSHHLAERLGPDAVAAHHGSLSRKLRLAAEKKLKSGEARALVATASLELGIDIGTVDLVCQIGSTRSLSIALQRVGRAGHWRGAVPKGRIFAMTRDELVECAALVRGLRRGLLDRIYIPRAPFDVLAQQVVAICAGEDWQEEDLFKLVRRAYPYADLPRSDFDEILEMLSAGIAAHRGRYGSYLHRDRVNGRVHGRRGSRLAAITGGGAIPDNALYSVVAMPEGAVVGTVDEDFAVESLRGDVMLLGNISWRIRRVESASGRLLVEDAHGAAPNVPFWRGEAPARSAELSAAVSELREIVSSMVPAAARSSPAAQSDVISRSEPRRNLALPFLAGGEQGEIPRSARNDRLQVPYRDTPADAHESAAKWLRQECGMDTSGSEQLIEYILAGRAVLGAVPTQKTIVAERFFDEAGGMQLILHAPFGGRINKAWGLALRKRFCRSFNFELQAAATEDGLNISLGEQHSFPLADVFRFLDSSSVGAVLEQAVLASPIFNNRWRWDATRSLALLRFRGGRKLPLYIQRMQADDLLAAVFPDAAACQENMTGDIRIPNHPLIREVMNDALTEAMDLEGLKLILAQIVDGTIECRAVDTPMPSVFSHEILNANPYAYLDDAPLEERRARAVEMRRALPDAVLEEVGQLDPAAIARVREEAWPDVRDEDEAADALQTLVALPEAFVMPNGETIATGWGAHLRALAAGRRAARAVERGAARWVSAEKVKSFLVVYPDACFEGRLAELGAAAPSREDAIWETVRGWMAHAGPVSAASLAHALGLAADDVEQALLRLEASGAILRGQFTERRTEEWCERRLLARIHRYTLGRLRAEIAPMSPAQFMRWLVHWQHAAPGAQVHGERGLLEVIRQLQGFEVAASMWESQVLAARVAGYDPKLLDQLCLTGAVGWGRISLHSALAVQVVHGEERPARAASRRVAPSSITPVAFFIRDEAEWGSLRNSRPEALLPAVSPAAQQVLAFLHQRGASFFTDIARATGRLKSEIEAALWELVAAGLATADGFDNLRALIDPKRRAGHGRGKTSRPRHSTGRWSLLSAGETTDKARSAELICRLLLDRYGVVFRELLARESFDVKWRELLVAFRRLEDRGEIRGGRFVDGFLGGQFALPVAVESLRAMRNATPATETVTLSAVDPLNLVGIVVPGERVPPLAKRQVVFRNGAAGVDRAEIAVIAEVSAGANGGAGRILEADSWARTRPCGR